MEAKSEASVMAATDDRNAPLAEEPCEEGGSNTKQRFCFDSDVLVLKNNLDYQRLLKTLAMLEAQKIQAIKDMECLIESQIKAERDPLAFLEALRNGTLPPLPGRQSVTEIPIIEWKGYMDSLQRVAKQHSSLYINTRRHSRPLISSLDEKPVIPAEKKDVNRSATYRQPWTPEEQTRFEELLKEFPPEKIESKRYQKIAKALGTRTPQQVATHVQKYFIKLAQSGLPVPGRVPNISRYSRKRRKGRGRRSGALRRPSTFFSGLAPKVLMTSTVEQLQAQADESESSESDSDCSEIPCSEDVGRGAVTCVCCGQVLVCGVYWCCSDCPDDNATLLCSRCVNSDYQSSSHLPSHDLQMLSIVYDGNSSSLFDKDYSSLSGYNYLDPNFHPPA